MKLWKYLAKHEGAGRRAALQWLTNGEVWLDAVPASNGDGGVEIDDFQEIRLRDTVLQPARQRVFLMLHKPAGYVSATTDAQHPTVLDLVDHPQKNDLHLVGRLDRWSTGLLLLTNDGKWSANITQTGNEVPKVYYVRTAKPLTEADVAAFAAGFYFHTENITTRPARLEILEPQSARITLCEGRYHQLKRMFYRVENRVTSLHRESIGDWVLPTDLPEGQWRAFSP